MFSLTPQSMRATCRLRVGSADVEGRLGADLADQVDLLRVDEGLVLVGIVLLANGDAGQGRTLLTEVGDDRTGIDTRDGGNTLTGTPLAQTLDGSPVAVLSATSATTTPAAWMLGDSKYLSRPCASFSAEGTP